MLKFTPLVESLPSTVPFVGPETQERARGSAFDTRLGANESVFGPSPKAIAAMEKAAHEVWKYCDPENYDVKQALAGYYDLPSQNFVVGEGIDGLLGYLVRMFVVEGTPVVTSEGAYPTFNFHVSGFGGDLIKVPYKGDHEDPMALIEKAKAVDAKLIYFANPDNPMGTWHSVDVVQEMIDQVPEDCLLILDEAYIEFAPKGTAPDFDLSNKNVIRMRTFSKAHGMAGARIGYAIGHENLCSGFNKVRNHFGVGKISQAGAVASLKDQAYLTDIIETVSEARIRISEIAETNGLSTVPSATNFVAVDCGRDGDFAKAVLSALLDLGVFVRMPFVEPQNRCIRASVGTNADLQLFASALPKALEAAKLSSAE